MCVMCVVIPFVYIVPSLLTCFSSFLSSSSLCSDEYTIWGLFSPRVYYNHSDLIGEVHLIWMMRTYMHPVTFLASLSRGLFISFFRCRSVRKLQYKVNCFRLNGLLYSVLSTSYTNYFGDVNYFTPVNYESVGIYLSLYVTFWFLGFSLVSQSEREREKERLFWRISGP